MGANISKIPPPIDAINCNLTVEPFDKNYSLSQVLDGYSAVEKTPGGWEDLKNWSPNVEEGDNSESLMSAIFKPFWCFLRRIDVISSLHCQEWCGSKVLQKECLEMDFWEILSWSFWRSLELAEDFLGDPARKIGWIYTISILAIIGL